MVWAAGAAAVVLLLGLVWAGWAAVTARDHYEDTLGKKQHFKDDEPYDTPGRPGRQDFPKRKR